MPSKRQIIGCVAACWLCVAAVSNEPAQVDPAPKPHAAVAADTSAKQRKPNANATIHWSGVTLREAVERLKALYRDAIFVDRRVDPSLRINLEISATSTDQVLNALASRHDLGVVRLGNMVYLGPAHAAQALPGLINQKSQEIGRLPRDARFALLQRRPLQWQRLSEPQILVVSLAHTAGWRIANSENIPFDLWDENALPDLSFAESLSVLLMGFDLTFELHPNDRTVHIVPLADQSDIDTSPRADSAPKMQTKRPASQTRQASGGDKQVFTLRVQEKPVGAVMQELARRLNWSLRIDEAAIQAAGKSLDTRVSFSVENADRERLLDALLTPAGLEHRTDGTTIYVTPDRYGSP